LEDPVIVRLLGRYCRDFTDGLRAGFDVLWWGQAYPRTLPLRRGGGMTAGRPRPDEVPAVLSPGWVSPKARRHLSGEDIERINQGRP
jgi:hypothetical protein